MSAHCSSHRFFWGLFIIVLGLLLIADNLGIYDFGDFVYRFWPLILILVGLKMIFTKRRESKVHTAGDIDFTDNSSSINFSHTFGDVRLRLNSNEFSGGEVSNVFGDVEIDLEEIILAQGSHKLNIKGVFGDMIIVLPKTEAVTISANTTFGSVRVKKESSSGVSSVLSYKSDNFDSSENKLVIKANQVFGDIRVF